MIQTITEKGFQPDKVEFFGSKFLMGNGYLGYRGTLEEDTREQLAAIFQRYAGFKGMETSGRGDLSQFGDTGALSNWAQEGVSWAVGAGLISGKGDGVLDPQGATTRAEAAVILQRFLEK